MVNTLTLAMICWMNKQKTIVAPCIRVLWCQCQCMWHTECRSGLAESSDLRWWGKKKRKEKKKEKKRVGGKEQSKFFWSSSRTRGSKKIYPAVRCGGRHTRACSRLGNKFCILKHQGKYKQIIILDCWIKRNQLDVTCFIISLFNAQHDSDVNTSILRSLRLICWVISWVVLLWFDVCWCYVAVWLWWCGIWIPHHHSQTTT